MRYFVRVNGETFLFIKKLSRDEYAAEEILNKETNVIIGTIDSIDGIPIADLRLCTVCGKPIPDKSSTGKKLGTFHLANKKTCSSKCFSKLMRKINLKENKFSYEVLGV